VSAPNDSRIPDAHYEALRAQMIGSTATAPVRGVGLALLLQQGMAAWLQAVRTCISPSPPGVPTAPDVTPSDDDQHAALPVSRGPRADVIPWAQHAEVATLLASLVLSARSMRRDRPAQDGEYV
jgi:hypothetical protein